MMWKWENLVILLYLLFHRENGRNLYSFNYEVNFMSLTRILKILFRETMLLLVMNLLEKFWDVSKSQTKLISFTFFRIFVTSHGFNQILSFSCNTLSVPVSA